MTTVRTWLAICLAGLAVVLTGGSAQAYPDGSLSISVTGSACSAASIPVVVDGGGAAADFVVTFNGRKRTGTDGTSFATTVKAPTVTSTTSKVLTATATYADGSVLKASAKITIKDCVGNEDDGIAPDDSGALPNTGGAPLWLLVLATGLVLVGGGVTALRVRD